MENIERIMEKIKHLLNVTEERGASEGEAINAALAAQKLMAKYNIKITDIDSNDAKQEIIRAVFEGGKGYKWRFTLANIIADNFQCKLYSLGREALVFYGYEKDATIAREVFKFLFNNGNKLAAKYYNKIKKEGKSTTGVLNTYLMGFCQGIKDVLCKQCHALALVTPPEVVESFNKEMSTAKTIQNRISTNRDKATYDAGRTDGRNTANSRSIEG